MNSYLIRPAAALPAIVLVLLIFLTAGVGPARGATIVNADVTTPGDPVLGVSGNSGNPFQVSTPSTVGTNGFVNNYPSNQPPAAAIDDNPATKYANYQRTGVGFITTLAANGPAVVRGVRFQTADDFSDRDPLSITLQGVNAANPDQAVSNVVWTTLYSGTNGLAGVLARSTFGPPVNFTNNLGFNTYRLIVNGIRVGSATNVQIGEVELIGFTTNAPPGIINIPATGPLTTPATTYPSSHLVADRTGVVDKVTVTLSNVTHTRIQDLDVLLVSPSGQAVKLLCDVGNAGGATNVTFVLADSAPGFIPAGPVVSGTFKPTDYSPGGDADIFPAPVTNTTFQTTLAGFAGQNPNGVWNLYVVDDYGGSDGGSIGDWSLTITTTNAVPLITMSPDGVLPYPSVKTVSGFTNVISRVSLTLNQITQNPLEALDVLLVSPSGRAVRVMSDAGANVSGADLTLTLDDQAPYLLPGGAGIASGVFRPTDWPGDADDFPAPAPAGPYTNNMSGFAGLDPNGEWSLYVVRDMVLAEAGKIQDWSLSFVTTNAPPVNDVCAGAITLTNGVPFSMSTATATSAGDLGGTCIAPGNAVWFTFTPPVNGLLRFNTCMSSFDTAVQVFTGSCSGLVVVTNSCNNDNGPLCGGNNASVTVPVTAGVTYWIEAGGFNSARGILNVVADLVPRAAIHSFSADQLTASSARISTSISTFGLPATVLFQFGLTTNYGVTQVVTDFVGGDPVPIQSILSGLVAGQTYHYRVVVTNAGGITAGADDTFTLPGLAGDLTSGYAVAWGDNSYGQSTVPTNLGRVKSIAGGLYHTIALRANGTVAAWGLSAFNQTNVPPSATNVMAIAAGDQHNVALRSNGTVVAWGDNSSGQTNVPASATNVIAVSAGNSHSLALRADGTMVGWGFAGHLPPAGISNLVAISSGGTHGLGLRNDGTVLAWGVAPFGQTNIPAGLSNVVAIAAGGESHSMALRNDGRVFVWGSSAFGQTVVPPAATNGVIAIAAGGDHCLALTTNGTIVSWGKNTSGQTNAPKGIGNLLVLAGGDDHSLAVALSVSPIAFSQTLAGPASSVLPITLPAFAPNGNTLAYRIHTSPDAGNLYQYEMGVPGALIVGSATVNDPLGRVFFSPTTGAYGSPYARFRFFVNDGIADSDVATITVNIQGAPHVFTAPATTITLSNAQLNAMVTGFRPEALAWFEWGTGTSYGNQTPAVAVTNGTRVSAVKSTVSGLSPYTIYHGRAVASNDLGITYGADVQFGVGRNLFGWGFNGSGQLNVPATLSNVVALAPGLSHTLVLKADGTAVGWGSGAVTNVPTAATNLAAIASGDFTGFGLRTNGSIVSWNAPSVPPLSNVVAVSYGNGHGVALREDGTVAAWGSGFSVGQTNVPVGLSNVVAISVGGDHTLALRDDGTVVAWGSNNNGQSAVPPDLTNVIAIAAAGEFHSMALRRDGRIVAWGLNASGQTNVPTSLSNVVAIAAGGEHNLALTSDGAVVAWGRGVNGQTNVPPFLTNVISIAGGDDFSLALTLNVAPVASPLTVYGTRDTDLVISLSATDGNSHPITLRVRTLPLSGTLYQYDAAMRGAAIVAPDTVVTDPSGRVIFAPAPGTSGSPYASFEVVANDGALDSAPALITIHIMNAPFATTQPATPLGGLTARLNGMVTPLGPPTMAWFEWGTNSSYGEATPAVDVGAGSSVVFVTNAVSLATQRAALHFRLVASNSAGITYGAEQRFGVARTAYAWGSNVRGQTNVPPGVTNAVSIAGGFDHTVVLRNDGTLTIWGSNTSGQLNIPVAATNLIAISAGDLHTLALRADGIVLAWGNSTATNTPANLSNVVAISAGGAHNMALKSDGTVVSWGFNGFNQTNVPPGLSNVVGISSGGDHDMALRNDGTVVAWGLNGNGQTNVPAGLNDVVAVAGGGRFHSLALKRNGTIVGWGNNGAGQLNIPPDASSIIAIGPGGDHNVALKSDGTAVAWGLNGSGQTNVPAGVANVTSVAGGDNHSMALVVNSVPTASSQNILAPALTDVVITLSAADADGDALSLRVLAAPPGQLYQYDAGVRGALMSGTDVTVTDPSQRVILALTNRAASFQFRANDGDADSSTGTITVTPAGQPFAHTQPATRVTPTSAQLNGMATPNGSFSFAWFEWGTTTNYGNAVAPLNVGSGSNVVYHTGTISGLSSGTIYHARLVVENVNGRAFGADQMFGVAAGITGWGLGQQGQLNVPANLSNAVSVAAGRDHSVALRADGFVTAWGGNSSGQTNVPAGLSNVVAIAAGDLHNLALRADGTVTNWGLNNAQNTPPAGLNNVIAVGAGANHNVALRSDGTVVAWGSNVSGQTNAARTLSNMVAIAAGGDHSLAIRNDGTVVAWGLNSSGQTNVPPGLSNVVAVSAAGDFHSMAMTKDGNVFVWGSNGSGQTNIPPDLASAAAISAGGNHNLVLQRNGAVVAWGRNFSSQTVVPLGLTNVFAIAGGDSHNLALTLNTAPIATPQVVPGRAYRDLMITLTATDVNGGTLTYRIVSLPAGASLYQYDAGARGPIITAAGTAVSDASGRVIISLASEDTTFSFVANDGELDSVAASVEVVVAGRAFATTRPAHVTSSGNLQLNGFATANLYPSMAWFEWGSSATWGNRTAPFDIGSGTNVVPMSAILPAPSAGFAYHFRLVVSNEVGVARGADQTFGIGRSVIWGNNPFGMTNAPAVSNVVSVAGGLNHSMALRSNGTVVVWGDPVQTNVPPGATNIIAISAGDNHSVALREDGKVFVWGIGTAGQTNVPLDLTNAVAISAGNGFTLAMRADGRVVGWGFNGSGESTPPPGITNVVGFSAGGNFALALRNDGTVVVWGSNGNGQTNLPAGLNHVAAVSAGRRQHGLALGNAGGLSAWGNNIFNAVTIPASLGNLSAISAGGDHNLALKPDSTVAAWGRNNVGQTNVPGGLSNVVSIAAASDHNLAVRVATPAASAAFTLPANPVGLSTAMLNGSVFPGSEGATVYFEWGTTTNYGNVTAPAGLLPGIDAVSISQAVIGLSPESLYHFRIVAVSPSGTSVGLDAAFLTVEQPAIPGNIGRAGLNTNGLFELAFTANSNQLFTVLASTNLVEWTPVGSPTQLSPGNFQFIDLESTNFPNRFYQLRTP
jgi:alpha-tubulin suppressor-like RCC1 family protein/subtilisin-like proprotein convertase family protein